MGSPSTVFNLPPTSGSTRRAAQSQPKGSARAAKNKKESETQPPQAASETLTDQVTPATSNSATNPAAATPIPKPNNPLETGRHANRSRSVKRFEADTPTLSQSGRTTPVSIVIPADKSNSTKVPAAHYEMQATVEIPRINQKGAARKNIVPESFAPVDLNATVEIIRPKATVTSKKVLLKAPEQFATEEILAPQASTEKPQPRQAGIDTGNHWTKPAIGQHQTVQVYAKKIGEVLVEMGKVTAEEIHEALKTSAETGERLGRVLQRWNLIHPETLCRALSIQTGLPMTNLDDDIIPAELQKIFPLTLMMHHNFVPFDDSGAVLCVAACNPLDPNLIREQEKILHKIIEVFLAREEQVARQLDRLRLKLKTRSRRHLRYSVKLPVSYQFYTRLGARMEREIRSGTTVDISEKGCLFDTPAVLSDPTAAMLNGLYLNACIKADQGDIWAVCEAREIRVVEDSEDPRWLIGVEILDINPECQARLKGLCRRQRVMVAD